MERPGTPLGENLMGLSWDATKVEGFDSLTEDETVTRDALVFGTMSAGIHEISDGDCLRQRKQFRRRN